MTPQNNLSVLPFYNDINEQNNHKWWTFGRVYPLFAPANSFLPFQFTKIGLSPVPDKNRPLFANRTEHRVLTKTGALFVISDPDVHDAHVDRYSVNNVTRVYIENLPPRWGEGSVSHGANIVFVGNDDQAVLYYDELASTEPFSGIIDIPEGAVYMYVQATNSYYPGIDAGVYQTKLGSIPITKMRVFKKDGTLYKNYDNIVNVSVQNKTIGNNTVYVYTGRVLSDTLENGQYYLMLSDTVNTWYSDVFTVVNGLSGYLKLEWWDVEDFAMDAGTIVYTEPNFVNVLYLCSDIAKPDYDFDEDVIQRDGYTFPIKQVSYKRYRFSFLAPEYLLDVMRFVGMADHIRITKDGRVYENIDSFLLSPEWEKNGDVAVVDAEFTADTFAKKVGQGFVATT